MPWKVFHIISLLCLLVCNFCTAQQSYYAGTDFWIMAKPPQHNLDSAIIVYVCGDTACTGYVENPQDGYHLCFTVTPDSTRRLYLDTIHFLSSYSPPVYMGVHIHTSRPVYVYTKTPSAYGIDMNFKCPIFPTNCYNSEIRVVDLSVPSGVCFLALLATEDNTVIHVPNIPNIISECTFNLQKGQITTIPFSFFDPDELYSLTDTAYRIKITSNCKRIVHYFVTSINSVQTCLDRNLYKGNDLLFTKCADPRFVLGIDCPFLNIYSTMDTFYVCNQIVVTNNLTSSGFPGVQCGETADACVPFPPFTNVPHVFRRIPQSEHGRAEYSNYINLSYHQYFDIDGFYHSEPIALVNGHYFVPTEMMTTHWLFPPTFCEESWNTCDTSYLDIVIYVHQNGIHNTYLNGNLIPASRFAPYPMTHDEYYFTQVSYYNDSIPDLIRIDNPFGFHAETTEIGFFRDPYWNVTLPPTHFYRNSSGINYFTAPVAHSNLSPTDSDVVYRCLGDTLHLAVEHNPDSLPIDWIVNGQPYYNTQIVNTLITSLDTITVQLVINYNCPDTTTTFVVPVIPPVIPFSADTTVCNGTEISVENPDVIFYQWSTGANTPAITIDSAGYYSVVVANRGCTVHADSFYVSLYPTSSVDFGNDSLLCDIATLLLDATQPHPAFYLWQNNSTNTTYTVYNDGQYWVIITDNCLGASDTINIEYLQDFNIGFADDTTLCEGDELLLNAYHPYCNYLWQDGSTDSVYLVRHSGLYSVTATNPCYTETDDITVNYQRCEQDIFLPNSFTPNGDGLNDIFLPVFSYPDDIQSYSMMIYNRWGECIFLSRNLTDGWDGHGATEGVYVCRITYQTKGHAEQIVTGSMTVVR